MAKKQKEVKLVPTYGYLTNDDGNIEIVTILYNPETDEVEIDREEQNYKDEYRGIYDIQAKLAKNFVTAGRKK